MVAGGVRASRAPGLDWGAFFEAAGLGGRPTVVAWQPSAVTGVAALVAAQPLDAWKDYLRVRALDDHADVLPRRLRRRGGRRARRSTSAPAAGARRHAVGDGRRDRRALRRAPFPASPEGARARRSSPTSPPRFATTWPARLAVAGQPDAVALAKLDALYVGIGYPGHGPGLERSPHRGPATRSATCSAWTTARRRRALARLAQPYDPARWSLTPQTSGAVLNFQQNAYLFAAALLQPPKYDAAASDAAAYGAIGAIIGHDMSHFVDMLGADYEPEAACAAGGRRRRRGHEARRRPLVRQFSAYEPLPGLHVDGRLTRSRTSPTSPA